MDFPSNKLYSRYASTPSVPPTNTANANRNSTTSAETAVSEALLTLSSVASGKTNATATAPAYQSPPASASAVVARAHPTSRPMPPLVPAQQRRPSHHQAGPPRRVSLCSPAAAGFPPQWPQPFVPQQAVPANNMAGTYETPKRAPSPALYLVDGVPPTKKARTVSPINAPANHPRPSTIPHGEASVSCVCPICNLTIKGLGDHKVDWSQPIQGRQRAKTITAIKKHVKDKHEQEPIWNVIVNSLDVTPARSSDTQRVVTAQAFVQQALKKAALDQLNNLNHVHLRSLRWTEKMMDMRVGIASGFIMYGGHEFLRGKKCTDENGEQVNPKSLRNLAYSLLQSMYSDLMAGLAHHQRYLQDAMAHAPLGLLRNRFQLLFAAPDKWSESWYMHPAKYNC